MAFSEPIKDLWFLTQAFVLTTTGNVKVAWKGTYSFMFAGELVYEASFHIQGGQGTLRLDIDGSHLQDAAGNRAVGVYTGGGVHVIDLQAPSIAAVDPPAEGTYTAGTALDFIVHFDEPVTVAGTPRLALDIGSATLYADYAGGSGTSDLLFRYVVEEGAFDGEGVILDGQLDLNGGSIVDAVGHAALLALPGAGEVAGVRVDTVAPTVTAVDMPAAGLYRAGDDLVFDVSFSEAVLAEQAPRLVLGIGAGSVAAVYHSQPSDQTLRFVYKVQAGDLDTDGITLDALDLTGGAVTDLGGNHADVTLGDVSQAAGVKVDAVAPEVLGVAHVPAPLTASEVSYTVTFSEPVSDLGEDDFSLVATGSAAGNIASVATTDGITYTVVVADLTGQGTLRLDFVGNDAADAAGNRVAGMLAGTVHAVDHQAPSVTAVEVPAARTYRTGEALDFTVQFDEPLLVVGTPQLALRIGGVTVHADYVGGSGSSALLFRHVIQEGGFDADGIVLDQLVPNGSSMVDAAGHAPALALHGVADTRGVLVDAVAPRVLDLDAEEADGIYLEGQTLTLRVRFSEPVIVSGTGTLALQLATGAPGRLATYLDGSGTDTLRFTYTVQAGDLSADLDVTGTDALSLHDGSIRDAAGNDAVLELPVPGAPGSLSANRNLVIGNAPPVLEASPELALVDTPAWDSFAARSGQLVASDADGDVLRFSLPGGHLDGTTYTAAGRYGTLRLDAETGAWTFLPDAAAINALPAVQQVEQFTVAVSDAFWTVTGQLTVRIDGSDDLPLVQGGNRGLLAEDGPEAVGGRLQLFDAEGDAVSVVPRQDVPGSRGGRFSIDASGAWRYVADHAQLQDLALGQVLEERFPVQVAGLGEVSVVVQMTGANDAPVFDTAERQVELLDGQTWVTTVAAHDVDGDVLRYAIAGGTDAALFEIDADTGALRFRAAAQASEQPYAVVVQAWDPHGGVAQQVL